MKRRVKLQKDNSNYNKKIVRLQLMRSYETDSNGFNTKRELKSEAAELKTKGKDM